jgi:UDP-N-acetylglucosamine acyltransferase
VDRHAELADDVQIGAYVIIEGRVRLGSGCVVGPHSILRGHSEIGAGCKIGPAAYVGFDPQHLKYAGGETWLVVGERTIIREGTSLHRSTKPGIENATRVGADCFLMANTHVGHDTKVGDRVTLANGAMIGGHCEIGIASFLGGGSGIHQFVKIGRLVIVGGCEVVTRDVPPFAAVRYDSMKGYNAVGCRRGGISREGVASIRAAYRCIHTCRSTPVAVQAIRQLEPQTPEIQEILDFIAAATRGIQPSFQIGRGRPGADEVDE